MGSDIPTQSADKNSRLGDNHLAFVMDKDVPKERAQWSRPDMKDKIVTQTRKDPAASFVLDSGGPVLSARAAEERKRILGQGLTEVGGRVRAGLVRKAGVRFPYQKNGRSVQGYGGHAIGADLEGGGWRENRKSTISRGGLTRSGSA